MLIKNKKNNGFTLAELLIAIFVLTSGIISAYIMIQNSINATTSAKMRTIAAYLAQEGIEIVRNIRDTNFLEKARNPDNAWNEGLISGNYQADYRSPGLKDPSLNVCPNPCGFSNLWFLRKNNNDFYNYSIGEQTDFKRKITIQGETDILKVIVTVYWLEKSIVKEISIQENLYNWF